MIYLDERLPAHPKIIRAGERIGRGGQAQVFLLYVMGIGYARANLTDGHLPLGWVHANGSVVDPRKVAKALTEVGLWRRVAGGYAIHDFLDWNRKASVVKEKRKRDRLRKAAERAGRNGDASA